MSTLPPAGLKSPPMNLSHHFSEVTKNRQASMIKDFYKYFTIPGIGNLAGGLPNPSFFPFDTLEAQAANPDRWTPTPNYPGDQSTATTADKNDSPSSTSTHITVPKTSNNDNLVKKIDVDTALQYGMANGYPPLLSFIRQFTRDNLHPNVPYKGGPEVILTCGSTDGFSKTLELLTNTWSPMRGDRIANRPGMLCEVFVYSNVLNQARPRGVSVAPVEMDEGGMLPDGPGGLEDVLSNWDPCVGKRPHLLYTVSMGHNPTGGVVSVSRRKQIYAICKKYDVIIIEDDPYWYLQYPSAGPAEAKSRGRSEKDEYEVIDHSAGSSPGFSRSSGYEFIDSLVPSYLSIDTDGRVIRLDTFSKTVAPGCRLGWLTAQPAFIERFTRITETSTQQPSGFVQGMIAQLIMGTQTETISHFFSLTPTERETFTGWSTDGWVRWLEGLRGTYERRMGRMCRILDSSDHYLKTASSRGDNPFPDWTRVSKKCLLSFAWPRGGMFVWLRVHLESHPCYMRPSRGYGTLDGSKLAEALLKMLTMDPFKVLPAPGAMFAADEVIRAKRAWSYFRLCFAAESEDAVDDCARRFAEGIQVFFKIREVARIEELLDGVKDSLKQPRDGVLESMVWGQC